MNEKKPNVSTFRAQQAHWLDENWDFLLANYAGMWVAVHGSALVGSGKTLEEADDEAAAAGFLDPLFDVVPRREYQNLVLVR